MTLESAPSPYLAKITALLEDHSASTGKAVTLLARISGAQLTKVSLSQESGDSLVDENLIGPITDEIERLISTGDLPVEGDLRLQTLLQAPAQGEVPLGDPGDLSSVTAVNNNGLLLRSALLKLGHGTGYSAYDIDKVTKERGKTLPELRFYRSFVREGKVAEGPHGDIFSSDLGADFGASSLESSQVLLPPAHPNDVVQPLLTHKLWVELAQDSENLYAADLAPGAGGKIGQIIGRKKGEVAPPFLVARSLTQFITGDWVSASERAGSQVGSELAGANWETVSSLLVASTEASQALEEASDNEPSSAAEAYAQSEASIEKSENLAALETEEKLPAQDVSAEIEEVVAQTDTFFTPEADQEEEAGDEAEEEELEEAEAPSGGTFLDFAAIAAEDAARQAATEQDWDEEPEGDPAPAGGTFLDFSAIAAEDAARAAEQGEQTQASATEHNPNEPEDEIKDLRGYLETHNADKLNETERGLANDFAAIAFGGGTRREDSEAGDQEDLGEDTEKTSSKPAEAPLTRREAVDQENPGGFKAALKKFFLG